MKYNWQLWNNFISAAEELGLELRSQDGGCVYIEVPKDISQKFYVMCWTPLNKLSFIQRKQERGPLDTFEITNLIEDFRQNHSDFHLEFGAKHYQDGSMYWFPNLSIGLTPSKQEIIDAINTMMDRDNFEKNKLMAMLREQSE
jgi:hypothetical protein